MIIDYDILEVALAVLFLLLGLVLCFFGYRCFRFSLFTIAFMAGGAVAVVLAFRIVPDLIEVPAVIWLVYILVGGLCGFLAATLISIGMFISGFCGGFVFAFYFLSLVGYSGLLGPLILVTVTSGVICGIMTLMYKKPALVATTSLLGATLLASSIVFFAQQSLVVSSTGRYYSDYEYDAFQESINNVWWTMFAILLTFIGVGTLLQFKVTGKGIYHEATADEESTYLEAQVQLQQNPSFYKDLPTPTTTRASDATERV